MILILSHEEDVTATDVAAALRQRGLPFVMVDPGCIPGAGQLGMHYGRDGALRRTLKVGDTRVDMDDVRCIWTRRPGKYQVPARVEDAEHREWCVASTREAMAGFWQTGAVRWVPTVPALDRVAHNKPTQLQVAAAHGFRIPRTYIGNDIDDFLAFVESCNGQVITKTIWPHNLRRDGAMHQIFTQRIQRRHLQDVAAVQFAPVIAQEWLAKDIELRVTVIAPHVFGAEIRSQALRGTRLDWRRRATEAQHAPHRLPPEIARQCAAVTRALGCCFGAIDLVLTPEGEYVFLEINPNGEWRWVEDATGLPMTAAMVDLLASAQLHDDPWECAA